MSGLADALAAFGFTPARPAEGGSAAPSLTDKDRQTDFVPVVPVAENQTGTRKAAPLLAVPVVPVVPDKKTKVESDEGNAGGLLGVSWGETHTAHKGMGSVQCGTCEAYRVDHINPMAGLGRCGHDLAYRRGEVLRYPRAWRECDRWQGMGPPEGDPCTGR